MLQVTRNLNICLDGAVVFERKVYVIEDYEDIPAQGGVYLLRDVVTNNLVYVGLSHRLQDRFNTKHHVYNPLEHNIELILIEDDRTRVWLEAVLASGLQPIENAKLGIRLNMYGGRNMEAPDYTKTEELEQPDLFPIPA